jgi:hypothetical protein
MTDIVRYPLDRGLKSTFGAVRNLVLQAPR